MADTNTITTRYTTNKTNTMDVLWGAWAKQINHANDSVDIMGIYDEIWKEKKSDFPFLVNLLLVLAYQADKSEIEQTYQVTLTMVDRFGIDILFSEVFPITVFQGDMPLRWYESYWLNNVEIREPDYYELNVLISRQFKQRIPLWILAPKMTLLDSDYHITKEIWPEDFNKEE